MDSLTLAPYVGSALLVVVAALPTVSRARLPGMLALMVGWVLIAVIAIRLWASRAEYSPNTEPSRVVSYGVTKLRNALQKRTPNLLVIEGGSYAARGIDPDVLSRQLRELGYRTDVVQLALGAANHFERHTMFSDLLRRKELSGLAKHSNLVFLAEAQVDYDAKPLAQLQENSDTHRAYHYLTPINGWLALWSLWQGGGHLGTLSYPKWTVFRHTLVNAFNVGLSDSLVPWKKIKPRSGYVKGGREAGYEFRGLSKVRQAATGPLPRQDDRPWVFDVRERRLQQLFGNRIDHWVYFGVPATVSRQTQWLRSFCSTTQRPCIAANDPKLLENLDSAKMWHNRGHLSSKGASLYSIWLAERLAEMGVLRK